MNSLSLSLIFVLTYIVNISNAVYFKVICTPNEYGGQGVSVNIDGTSYPMTSAKGDILYELKFDGTPNSYYYEITGTVQNELSIIGQPRTWDPKSTTTFYEVYGRKHSIGDDIIKTIPRLYEPIEGYNKFSPLFQEGEVPVLSLHLSDADYIRLTTLTTKTKEPFIVEFDFYTPYEHYHYTNVTLGFSGQGSRDDEKKPYKIDLSKGDSDKSNTELLDRKEFKLRNLRLDQSHIRNKLVEDIAESLGVPVTQSTFCRLYINNRSYGLYELSDLYKKKFIRNFFNPQKNSDGYVYGSLYKGVSGKNEQGKDIPAYLYPDMENAEISELYESVIAADPLNPHAELNKMITWLNALPDNASKEEIEKKFDLDMFLKYMVIEYLICHWDGLLGNGNNFFIYAEPNDGKYHVFSYDFDSTLGTYCEANAQVGNIDTYVTNVVSEEDRAYGNLPQRKPLLYSKILKNPNIEPIFVELIKEVVGNLFNIEALGPRIDYFYELLKEDINWDIDALNNGLIETKLFKDKAADALDKAKAEAEFNDTVTNTDYLKAYIKARSASVGQAYGITSFVSGGKCGTVGGKLMTIGKEKDNKTN